MSVLYCEACEGASRMEGREGKEGRVDNGRAAGVGVLAGGGMREGWRDGGMDRERMSIQLPTPSIIHYFRVDVQTIDFLLNIPPPPPPPPLTPRKC